MKATKRSKPSEADPDLELLTVGEAAARLRIGETTLRSMANAGEIKVVRFRAAVRVPASEVKRLLAGS